MSSAARDVKAIVAAVLSDRSKVKQLPELLKAVDDEKATRAALNGMAKVFTHLIRKGDFRASSGDGDANDAAVKYSSWLKAVFDEAWDKILGLFADENLCELALSISMRLLAGLHEKDAKVVAGEDLKRLRSILEAILARKNDAPALIRRYQEYVEYLDVKFYTVQILSRHIRSSKADSGAGQLVYKRNLLGFLEIVNYDGDVSADNSTSMLCTAGFDIGSLSDAYTKNFNSLWEDFLKLGQSDVDVYKRTLILLTDKVMQRLQKPLLLTDFLMESYAVGGSISLLALKGVFVLISEHNLEYPDFYTKLYALCTPELLHAKYRARFFHMANIFLSSSHLPEYLVAAFVKRLSRLCLTGPASAILLVLPFVGNLMMRHRGLLKMVDNPEENFDADEPDPSKSRAIESGVWEIRTLQSHSLPQVSQAAKFINKPLLQMEWNLDDYLEASADDMFAVEAKKKIFVNVALTFDRPKGLCPKDDVVFTVFE